MTSADVRDMLGLPSDGQPKIRPPKKFKQEAKGRRPGTLNLFFLTFTWAFPNT